MYGSLNPHRHGIRGRPRRLTSAAKEALLEYQNRYPWANQDELVWFLEEEWGLQVSRPTISRFLKENRLSRQQLQRVGPQSEQLRIAWQAMMLDLTAEQLVFLDEALFKMQTGWRCMAYGPIGQRVIREDDSRRGDTWSILPAYTVDGYLPCTSIRLGYFNGEAFYNWVVNELLPHCNPYPQPLSAICLDNVSIHLNPRARDAIEAKGCLLRFLPPYSPDYSPIQLTFSMLKAWMRRHFRSFRELFEGDFGGVLAYAIENSGCDRKATERFRHCAGGYLFEGDYEAFQRELATWSLSEDIPE